MSPLLELVIGILLAAGGVYFVLRPILAPAPSDNPSTAEPDDAFDPEDDLSTRAIALRALKEIEFDRATGKLGDADYESLKQKYTAEALEALREEVAKPQAESARRPAAAASAPAPRGAPALRACPTHGPRPESDADFCSECGRRLAPAAGFCGRCGTSLEPDARFCARCGGRVAA